MNVYLDIIMGLMVGALAILVIAGVVSIISLIWQEMRNGRT